MEIIDPQQKQEFENKFKPASEPTQAPSQQMGRILAGIVIIIVGGLLLIRKMGIYLPEWLFSWQMLAISIGVFVGARHNFKPGGWIVPILVGCFFLLDDWLPFFDIKPYFWPVILILVGMVMIMTPGSGRSFRGRARRRMNWSESAEVTDEDIIDSSSVFGGVKKNIISKNFKGGEISAVFGGAEINFTQADIQSRAVLEVNAVFGGVKLIIPSNWTVQSSEITAVLGGVEDNRILQKGAADSDKILVLKGSAVFGGISLKSF